MDKLLLKVCIFFNLFNLKGFYELCVKSLCNCDSKSICDGRICWTFCLIPIWYDLQLPWFYIAAIIIWFCLVLVNINIWNQNVSFYYICVMTRLIKDRLCIKIIFMHTDWWVNYFEKYSEHWHICLSINQTHLIFF